MPDDTAVTGVRRVGAPHQRGGATSWMSTPNPASLHFGCHSRRAELPPSSSKEPGGSLSMHHAYVVHRARPHPARHHVRVDDLTFPPERTETDGLERKPS